MVLIFLDSIMAQVVKIIQIIYICVVLLVRNVFPYLL